MLAEALQSFSRGWQFLVFAITCHWRSNNRDDRKNGKHSALERPMFPGFPTEAQECWLPPSLAQRDARARTNAGAQLGQ